MGNKAITQIILVVVSVVIITTYIKPAFEDMGNIRTEANEYQTALENANSYNNALQELYARANSFTISERRALDRYLPKKIDTVAVMRDVETIVRNNGMSLVALASTEIIESNKQEEKEKFVQGRPVERSVLPVNTQRFSLSVSGTYGNFKSLLQDFERNAYPLSIAEMSILSKEEDRYDFSLTLETYSLVIDGE